MRAFWALFKLRLFDILRSKSTVAFLVVFPVVLLVVVALVFMNGHPFEQKTVLIVGDGTAEAAEMKKSLGAFEELRVEVVPTEKAALGRLRAKTANAIIEKTDGTGAYAVLVGPRDRIVGRGIADSLASAPRVDVVDVPKWGYVHFIFPGVLAFSIMLSGLFATGSTMVLYRQNRFLKKLATTPLPKITFVLAQIGARSLMVLAQIVLLLVVGVAVFGVPIDGASALTTLGLSLLGLLAFMGIGFFLACLVKTEDLVVDVISAVNLPMVFLSEIFFPLDTLPGVLAKAGSMLPSTQMVRLTRATLLYGGASSAEWTFGLALIVAWTVLAFALSLAWFRWQD